MNLLKELRQRLARALEDLVADPASYAELVRPSQDPRFGDYQVNCAMPLAGPLKRKPRDIAEEIKAKLNVADLCETPQIAGPGFINLKLHDEVLTNLGSRLIEDEKLGVVPVESPRNYIIDFSSPNVAKPMHVGHLRSSVLGDALCRILRFLGHNVTSDNHIGDWGTQFGMIIYGYKHFLDAPAFENDAVGELARLYRLVNQLSDFHQAKKSLTELKQRFQSATRELDEEKSQLDPKDKQARKKLGKKENDLKSLKEDIAGTESKIATVESDAKLKSLADSHPQIAKEARLETARLHAGDETNTELWQQFLPACLEMLHAMYRRLEIEFDLELGESYYQPLLADVVRDLEDKELAKQSDGATCIFIEGNDAPFIVRKQDGAYTYATTDLATIQYRVEKLNADEVLYVVDARQGEHFKLLFESARLWGFEKTKLQHVSFGTILGEDKRPFKTRSGDTVGLNSLIDEAIEHARKIIDAADDAKPDGPELDETTRQSIAETVGIGAIKYADLRHNRDSDYVFSWDKMLATDGDTATYIQYAHARVCGIFRKGNIDRDSLRKSSPKIELTQPEERQLLLQLLRFPEAVADVALDYRPNLLAQYLFELANAYSSFFVNCPVLKAESDSLKQSRLLLCDLTARVLETGLELLGITAPEKM